MPRIIFLLFAPRCDCSGFAGSDWWQAALEHGFVSPVEIGIKLMSAVMTPVIATRTMTRTRQDGVKTTITVEIGQPVATESGDRRGKWYCTMQILGIREQPEVYTFANNDSISALMSAMYAPGVLLRALPYASEIDFSEGLNFLFPVPPIPSLMQKVMAEQHEESRSQEIAPG